MVELILLAPAALVETLSDALLEVDALSVTVQDADADSTDERPIFGEPGMPAAGERIEAWRHSVLRALFTDDSTATEAATLLLAQDWAGEVRVLAIEIVAEQDWVQLTQSQFDPIEIAPAFWIVPSWHEPPAAARRVMRLDPGLAFGTGTHPTTRMCLRWIAAHEAQVSRAARILDYGCGSGVLAIGAALHGATSIDAVDIDPAAVGSTTANAAANGVAGQIHAGLPDLAQGRYDIVLANILATPLRLLAPVLCGHLAPGAPLVLAGILERQADELRTAYAPWVELDVADRDDGWILMTAMRPMASSPA